MSNQGMTGAAQQSGGTDVRAAASVARQEITSQVSGLTQQIRQQATDQVSSQKDRVAEAFDNVAQLLRQSSDQAGQQASAMIAGYLDQASGKVEQLSETLRTKEPAELVEQTKQFASRQPLLFFGSAAVVGFLGTRFLRSSK